MKDADYALALYVMMSRATKLSDLHIVGLPDRRCFEGFLHDCNGRLVERMQNFEAISTRSMREAKAYITRLGWERNHYVQRVVGDDLRGAPESSRLTKRGRVADGSRPADA